MKINKFSNDLPKEIVAKIKDSVAIDTEATGLKIPERDKLSLIQLCDASVTYTHLTLPTIYSV